MADDLRRLELTQQLDARSPLSVDGVPFTLRLSDIIYPIYPEPHQIQAVRVLVEATNGPERHTGELHVSEDRFRSAEFMQDVISMMNAIIRGDLPPGTRELL